VGGYWQLPYTWSDANGDGIIRASEVSLDENSAYLGSPLPSREFSISPSLTLFGRVRMTALMNYRGGHRVYNAGSEFRCAVFVRCEEAYAPGSSLSLQARRVAGLPGTSAGYIETPRSGSCAKSGGLRRPGRRGPPPARLSPAHAGRAQPGHLDQYTGFDPEITFNRTSNYSTAEFFTQPPSLPHARIALGW
jgi:hypothetical protein